MENTPQKSIDRRQVMLALALIVLFAIVGVLAFFQFYDAYLNNILYAERQSQMKDVTTQLFSGLEDAIDHQWDGVSVQNNYLSRTDLRTTDAFVAYLGEAQQLNNLDGQNKMLFGVDNLGRCYNMDGIQGTLDNMEPLMGRPERVSFVVNTLTTSKTSILFLERLETPLTLEDGSKTVTLEYYGILEDMHAFTPYFICDAYDGNNTVYVLNENGVKFFYSGTKELLPGYNVYKVLRSMEYLHDSSFAATQEALARDGVAYSNAVLNGQEYYYALYQMENAAWTLLFLVPSDSVAVNTVSMVNTTVMVVALFAIILMGACAALIVWLLRQQQKVALAVERKNNANLNAVNQALDQKNYDLARAVEVAETAFQTAETASRAKSDFLANMSHDIRTPMNAIVGITNLMEYSLEDPEKLHGYLSKIQVSSRHLLRLINDILDMSRIESAKVTLNQEPMQLGREISQLDSIIRPQANEHRHSFHISIHGIRHEALVGDGTRLRQILLNILSNAVKYTPDGGKITMDITEITSKTPSLARYRFTITDNGYGMSPKLLQRLFEPFTRGENSVTNKIQGTGLGMAITKSIIDMMGGMIHVESKEGQGSKFEVILSFRIHQENPNAPAEPAFRAILISRDDLLLDNVTAALSERHEDIRLSPGVYESLDLLMERPADVILINGWPYNHLLAEAVQTLRQFVDYPLTILCLDNPRSEEETAALRPCGVDGLVLRPFFLSNVTEAVEQARRRREKGEEEGSALRGMHFLCAEDNELNADILSALLETVGASCVICSDGVKVVEAFAQAKPGEYDAILMDVQMPNKNGYEATRDIRAGSNPEGKTIPIIAMTANAFADDVRSSIEAGMNLHISKPLELSNLEKAVRTLCHHSSP